MQKKPFKSVSPHPNFPKLEEEILKFWEENKIFEKSLERNAPHNNPRPSGERGRRTSGGVRGEPFIFYEGPPTANAAPGIHHVEARSFKDIIPRFQTMRGRFVARKAGWDTHGLPVELQIEKKLGISGKKQIESLKSSVRESIAYFNQLCKESVWQYKGEWENLTRRMGFWIDMEHPYITYENSYIEKVWGILKQIWDKGLIYQGHKVVPYCPRCGTALSSHEVAQGYETITDNSVIVKFKIKDSTSPPFGTLLKDGEGLREGSLVYILSWTTTPWTLPGNVALAVGENIDYVMVKGGDEYYIGAEGKTEGEVVEKFKGKDLVGLEYEPLFDIKGIKGSKGAENAFKVYAADFVSTGEGTGIVHTAVMYGEDDYELGEKTGLPKHHTVDEEGKFTADLANYGLEGLEVKDKNTESKIIEHLKSKNLLFKEEPYEHDYPFCWRCAHYLIYYARNSWFIKMSSLREELIKNNQQINWIPEYIKEGRFGEWLREVKDWAISRERYWGTPLPMWQCLECKEYAVIGSIEELKEKSVRPLPQPLPVLQEGGRRSGEVELDLHRPYVDDIKLKCEKCGKDTERVPEVLDVWFDSGAMPFASGQNQFPADFISEAIDQTRGWFYTLLAIATALGKGIPYKNVISLGLLFDEKGEKMSKSKGNVVNPVETGDKYGFDIIRWYFYSINQPGDAKLFAEKELVRLQRQTQNIIWNVYNYFVTYANSTPSSSPPYQGGEREGVLDQWINARLQELISQTTQSLENFDAFHAARTIEKFINDLSTWYLRRSRGREDGEFLETLYKCLLDLTKIMSPFMPFLSEAIFRNLTLSPSPISERGGERLMSVHLENWPEVRELTDQEKSLLNQMDKLREIVEQAHALRAKAGVKLRQPLARFTIPPSLIPSPLVGEGRWGGGLRDILKDEVNVKEIAFGDKLELDTAITEELKIEGMTRELERRINEFRKESGLKIGEQAELYYQTESAMMEKALQAVDKKKTYLEALRQAQGENQDFQKEVEINNEKLWLAIKNIQG